MRTHPCFPSMVSPLGTRQKKRVHLTRRQVALRQRERASTLSKEIERILEQLTRTLYALSPVLPILRTEDQWSLVSRIEDQQNALTVWLISEKNRLVGLAKLERELSK